jgi:hypothetical protein
MIDIYELSPIQRHAVPPQFAPESPAYFNQFSCRLSGAVDPSRVARGSSRRSSPGVSTFHWEGLTSPQVVHQQATLPWTRTIGAPARRRAGVLLERGLDADHARLEPNGWSAMRAAIARIIEDDHRSTLHPAPTAGV